MANHQSHLPFPCLQPTEAFSTSILSFLCSLGYSLSTWKRRRFLQRNLSSISWLCAHTHHNLWTTYCVLLIGWELWVTQGAVCSFSKKFALQLFTFTLVNLMFQRFFCVKLVKVLMLMLFSVLDYIGWHFKRTENVDFENWCFLLVILMFHIFFV